MTSSTPAVSRNAGPFIHGPEIDVAAAALHAGQYGHGEATERFERELARFLGVADVVAVSSGTAALGIALLTAGVGPGDEVIVPSQTFCATIQAIIACGATPHFVEHDPGTLCVDARVVLEAMTPATRAVVPVLYGGRAVDLRTIHDDLERRGITIVEDAAHAFGSYLGPRRVGATDALTCFSFGPIKNLTCIEGGAVIPRDERDATVARRLRTLGITTSQAERMRATSYIVDRVGVRGTMSCVHAAVGRVQLQHFGLVEERRKRLWRAYAAALHALEDVAAVDVDVDHTVPFNCVVRVPARDAVHRILAAQRIGVGVHYPPNHIQPAFARWYRPLPITEQVGREILSLPFHPHMTTDDVNQVVDALGDAVARARHAAPWGRHDGRPNSAAAAGRRSRQSA